MTGHHDPNLQAARDALPNASGESGGERGPKHMVGAFSVGG
jgi:hypothetical protein